MLLGGRWESPSLVSSSVSFQCMLASLVSIYLFVCHHDTKLWAWSNRLSDDPLRSSWNSLLMTSWVCEGYENVCQEALFFPESIQLFPEAAEGFGHLHWKKGKGQKERNDPWGLLIAAFSKIPEDSFFFFDDLADDVDCSILLPIRAKAFELWDLLCICLLEVTQNPGDWGLTSYGVILLQYIHVSCVGSGGWAC